jgi:hypothetical protein
VERHRQQGRRNSHAQPQNQTLKRDVPTSPSSSVDRGLDTLPIAIQAFDAVAARCSGFDGPNAENVHAALRERLGAEQLEWVSHFGLVETLLTETLNHSALDLRLQSLSNDMRMRLRHLATALTEQAEVARANAASAETRLEAVLRVIGTGAGSEQENLDRQWRRGTAFPCVDRGDLLTLLEDVRNQPFAAETLYGTVWEDWEDQSVLNLDVAALRETAEIEAGIRDAFACGKLLTIADVGESYEKAGAALAAAAQDGVQVVLTDLILELETLALRFAASAMHAESRADRGLDAKRGTGARNAARALSVATGVLLFVPIPGVNLLVAAGARVVGQILLSLFSRRSRAAGEKDRAEELLQALNGARNALAAMCDDVGVQAVRQIRELTANVAVGLRADIQAALSARETASQCEAAAMVLESLLEAMPLQGAGTAALSDARDRVLAMVNRERADDLSPLAWPAAALGEDWLDMAGNQRVGVRHPIPNPLPSTLVQPIEELTDRLGQIPRPSRQEVLDWFASVGAETAAELRQSVAGQGQRRQDFTVALTGPTRVGVTELKNALDTQLGALAHRNVRVTDGTGPNASAVIAEADVIALVMPPSLFGAGDDLDSYLGAACLRSDTRRRMVLILNRIDELAVDPDEDPEQLAGSVQRKVVEVSRFADRSGLTALPILAVSGAPSGQPCPTAPPWWSGVDRLANALSRAATNQEGIVAPVRAVVAALDETLAATNAQLESQSVPECVSADLLLQFIVRGQTRGLQLQDQLEVELMRSLERVVIPLAYDLAGAGNKAELRHAHERFCNWRTSTGAETAIEAFEATSVPKVEEWLKGVGRLLGWQPQQRPATDTAQPRDPTGSNASEEVASAASAAVRGAMKLVKQLGSHENYYALGKDLGVKFRPWQAVKGAQRLRNVSPAFSVFGGLLLAVEVWNSEKAEKTRNKLRNEAPKVARMDMKAFVDTYLTGTDDQPGLLHFVKQALEELEEQRFEAETTLATAETERARLASLSQAAQRARDGGLDLLNKDRMGQG